MIVNRYPMHERVPPKKVIMLAQDPGTFCAISGTLFQRSGLRSRSTQTLLPP